MTDPVRYLGFAQRDASGMWKQYQYRDDLDEGRGYWALKSNNTVEYVSPGYGTGDQTQGREPQRGRAAATLSGIMNGMGSAFDSVVLGSPYANVRDALTTKRSTEGSELSPEMLRAMRVRAQGFGFGGPGVTVENVADIINTAETVMRSLPDPDNFTVEFINAMGYINDPAKAAALYADTPEASTAKTEAFKAAGGTGPVGPVGPTTPNGTPVSGPELNTGGTFAGIASGGAGIGAGAQLPSKPGIGPGGVEVTPTLLREFVDSDWRLSMNAFVNQFRDAGGASIFLDFLQKKAVEFLGQYEGELAQQALDGKMPTGDFTSFLSRKHINGVGNLGGDPNADATLAFRESQARKAAQAAGGSTSTRTAAPGTVAPGAVNPTDVAVTPSAGAGANLTPNQALLNEYIGS